MPTRRRTRTEPRKQSPYGYYYLHLTKEERSRVADALKHSQVPTLQLGPNQLANSNEDRYNIAYYFGKRNYARMTKAEREGRTIAVTMTKAEFKENYRDIIGERAGRD